MLARILLQLLTLYAVIHRVLAQDQTFLNNLVSKLNSSGLTEFTSVFQQVRADTQQVQFFLSLSDSSTPKTLFVPNNDAFSNPDVNTYGFDYQPDSTSFLEGLLLYHLVSGTWNVQDLGTGPNHTIISSNLQGHGLTQLEGDKSQVIACGHSVAGFELYNQLTTTAVTSTMTVQHVTIHVINAILGIPGQYTYAANFISLLQFLQLQQSADVPSIENRSGVTLFVPGDPAFDAAKSQLMSTNPGDVFNNHVIYGQTIWYNGFESATYTSQSGHNYSFKLNPDLGYQVTLNGVSANIVRSDFLIENGVIHIIDAVLYNTTAEAKPSSAPLPSSTGSQSSQSTSGSSSGSGAGTGTGAATANTPNTASTGTSTSPPNLPVGNFSTSKSMSGGSIAGIVIGVVGGILIVSLIVFLLWRRWRARSEGGTYDPPTPYNPVPLDAPYAAGKGPQTSTMSSAMFAPATYHPPSYSGEDNFVVAHPPLPPSPSPQLQQQLAARGEKALYVRPDSVISTEFAPPAASSTSLASPQVQSPAASNQTSAAAVPLSDDIVDHILERFARRIDRGPGTSPDAPPMYPAH